MRLRCAILLMMICLCSARLQGQAAPALDRFWFDLPGGGPRVWIQTDANTWQENWAGGGKPLTLVGPSDEPDRPGMLARHQPSGLTVLIPPKGSGGIVGWRNNDREKLIRTVPRQELSINPRLVGSVPNFPKELDVGDKAVMVSFMRLAISRQMRPSGNPNLANLRNMVDMCRRTVMFETDASKLTASEKEVLAYLDGIATYIRTQEGAGGVQDPGTHPPATNPPTTNPPTTTPPARPPVPGNEPAIAGLKLHAFIIALSPGVSDEKIAWTRQYILGQVRLLGADCAYSINVVKKGSVGGMKPQPATAEGIAAGAAMFERMPFEGAVDLLGMGIRSLAMQKPAVMHVIVDADVPVPTAKETAGYHQAQLTILSLKPGQKVSAELSQSWMRDGPAQQVHAPNADTAMAGGNPPPAGTSPIGPAGVPARPDDRTTANSSGANPTLPRTSTKPGEPVPPVIPKPAAPPAPELTAAELARRQQETQSLFDHLMKSYDGLLTKTRDRVGRSLALVCIARIPRADATTRLMTALQTDRDVTVRMVAWQCLLARANGLTEAEFKRFQELTTPLMTARAFQGSLRIPLLQMLALRPPDAASRAFISRTIDDCNAQDPDDDPVLLEIARTVKAWGDPTVVDQMMPRLRKYDEMERVELILHALGCNEVWSYIGNRAVATQKMMEIVPGKYELWWKTERANWRPNAAYASGQWRTLKGQYVPTVDMYKLADPKDPSWMRDLELRPPGLQNFSMGLVVDTTGSMGPALVWIRRDLRRIAEAVRLVANEPLLTSTFYRDIGDQYVAKTLPLTSNLQQLSNWFDAAEAAGGTDGPEAVLEALNDNFNKGNYPTGGKKALVLVTDAPPHAATQQRCEDTLTTLARRGVHTYAVKVRTGYETGDLAPVDRLVAAGGGSARWFYLLHGTPMPLRAAIRGVCPLPPVNERPPEIKVPENLDPREVNEAGEWLMNEVLVGVINPQFGDRVQPVASIVWQMLKQPTAEKRIVYYLNNGNVEPIRKGIQDR